MNKPLILTVEDDVPVRNLITTTLKTHGYRILLAANGEAAILEASSHNPVHNKDTQYHPPDDTPSISQNSL